MRIKHENGNVLWLCGYCKRCGFDTHEELRAHYPLCRLAMDRLPVARFRARRFTPVHHHLVEKDIYVLGDHEYAYVGDPEALRQAFANNWSTDEELPMEYLELDRRWRWRRFPPGYHGFPPNYWKRGLATRKLS